MEFSEWLTEKYLTWRGNKIGNAGSITKFAEYIGVSQQLMTEWLKKDGKKPSAKKSIDALVAQYGGEVYDVLGYPRPEDPDPSAVLPARLRLSLQTALTEINTEYARLGISSSDPAALTIASSILSKHGFTISEILKD